MADIVGGGPPVNDGERRVIAQLRDHGPDDWLVLHNIEVPTRDGVRDIDVVVVTGHMVWLLEVKGTRGRIQVDGSRWYPSNRQPFRSPVAKLNGNARAVKGALMGQRRELNRVYVGALVVLAFDDAVLVDPIGRDSDQVTTVRMLIDTLRDKARVRTGYPRDIIGLRRAVIDAFLGSVRLPTGPPRYGNWEVRERLGGDERVTEYRAVNATAPDVAESVLLKVYRADPFQQEADRIAERQRIGNAYEALCRMPPHPCVIGRRDFFPAEDESSFVLVLDDVRGQSLAVHLNTPPLALGVDARLRVIRDVLRGLAHAHTHRVLHRALCPVTVIVGESGQALLTGFDYARPDGPRDHTVQNQLVEELDERFTAPECQGRPSQMSGVSDVYAAGVIAFRLLTGELPFASSTDQYEKGSVLPAEVMDAAGIPEQLADLLQHMCARTPSARLTAAEALRELNRYAGPGGSRGGQSPAQQVARDGEEPDYRELPQDYPLTPKYTIRRRLGRGTYGVVYQVYDDLAGADRAVKIVLRDRDSVVERLRQEYQVLINLPPHPNVVKVESADYLNGTRTPYIAFEYTAGHDVADLIKKRLLDPADVVRLGKDVARGLAFLHARSVWHCDIKPSNLFWTDTGCKILDFNVAVTADTTLASAPGGTLRYVPPDAGRGGGRVVPADLVDRDLYGLGIVLYELLAGVYPWDARQPPPGQVPRDPRTFTGLNDLSDALVDSLMKAISPRRSDRYPSADALLAALESIRDVHRRAAPLANQAPPLAAGTSAEVNPFVAHLKTLYSQSDGSNAGTRGRDPYKLYVSTALDDRLGPDVLAGRYLLVVITGNAGDGKTAFLESLTEQAQKRGADLGTPRDNGADFTFNGRAFHLNHDGSQDEGEVANDDVLAEFFAPYGGMDSTNWPGNETRLIAINEGRLVDFLSSHEAGLARLGEVIFAGLRGEPAVDGVLVVNLNRRDILADVDELQGSIFDRMLASMTNERHWEACGGCRLAKVCYATHNARTFAHPSAGARIRERLRALNQLVQLRGRMHITIRDLRSALAFMLTSGRDCRQIQQLYAAADAKTILDSFYFNSWLGAAGTSDRLLAELAEVDVAAVPDPVLDRQLDYAGPYSPGALRTVDQRGHYDRDLLQTAFQRLPRGARSDPAVVAHHTQYVAAARRRFYFECVDDERAARMLPYRTVGEFRGMLRESGRAKAYLADVIAALNRSEGMPDAGQLGDALALRLDHVPTGTIRSYRAFPVSAFSLEAAGGPESAYLEGGANELLLRHESGNGHATLLQIRLDLFELLRRLGDGYLPGIAESQGLYLALTIFKNELSAAPYQEVLLTTTGNDLRRIRRESDGRLIMEQLPGSEARWGAGGQHR